MTAVSCGLIVPLGMIILIVVKRVNGFFLDGNFGVYGQIDIL